MKAKHWFGILVALLLLAWPMQILMVPRVSSPLALERRMAVTRTNDQTTLAQIALNDGAWQVRLAAIENLSDQAALAHIAINDDAREARLAAVEKLNDQAALAQIAINSDGQEVRLAAVEKLTDLDALSQVAINCDGRSVRRAAVEKLTDQDTLNQVAISSGSWLTRRAAVNKLTDQNALAHIAINDSYSEVRFAAVEKLTDQEALVHVTLNDDERVIRSTAIEKLTAEGLESAAIQADDFQQRALLITTAQFLTAVEDVPAEHRLRILTALMPVVLVYMDPDWLECIGSLRTVSVEWSERRQEYHLAPLRHGESVTITATFSGSNVRHHASWISSFPRSIHFNKTWVAADIRYEDIWLPWLVGDQATLAKIATRNSNAHNRHVAVEKLTDQAALAQVAIDSNDWTVRRAAVGKLTDLTLLAYIADNDSDKDVRRVATSRLAELQGLRN